MKKLNLHQTQNQFLFLLALSLLIPFSVFPQKGELILEFAAKDFITNNPVLLDSIKVINLNEGGDTTIYGESPSLYIEWISAIDENSPETKSPIAIQSIFPNPSSGLATAKIFVEKPGVFFLNLLNINGEVLASLSQQLDYGSHIFTIKHGNPGICFLTLNDGIHSKTVKLLSLPLGIENNCSIEYSGISFKDGINSIAAKVDTVAFTFKPGNILQYDVSADGYEVLNFQDSPTESRAYVFALQAIQYDTLPTVTTADVENILANSAISGGIVHDQGSSIVSARGVCWDTLPNPSLSNFFTVNGAGEGEFVSELSGLSESTTYYVRAYATNTTGTAYGEEIQFTTMEEIPVLPLYLIGDGTTTGWDNTNTSLEFTYDSIDQLYQITATLGGGGLYYKALVVPGEWAPQWGTDETGTSVGGPLVYRPNETEPDPLAMPTPAQVGDYLITFDLLNLLYTIEDADLAQTMHLVGDATEAGWDNTAAIPMEKIAPGKFHLVANLDADAIEGFKFLVNQGAWAPMYGTIEGASFESGVLVYRETESDPDPRSIPPPETSGDYFIEINIIEMTYAVSVW